MSDYRFYVPDLQTQVTADHADVLLPEEESHHLRSVLRIEEGSPVSLFDGRGAVAAGMVTRVSKREARVLVAKRWELFPRPKVSLTIYTAVPKGDRAEQLIDQASQLNAAAVAWIDCDRSVVKPREGGHKMEKWRRQAVESAKQCGRSHLLEIRDPVSVAHALRDATTSNARLLWMQPGEGGVRIAEVLAGATSVSAFIGPEGGWSDAEVALFEAGIAQGRMARVRLTETVLRIETACAAAAAAVMSLA